MMRYSYGLPAYGYHMSGIGILFCIIGMLFFFALTVLVVTWIIRALRHPAASGTAARPSQTNARAIEILNERLAKGEISITEYEQLKAQIIGSSHS